MCTYMYKLCLQELAEELGSFARVTTLQDDSANLVSVIQAAYNVRFDLCMTIEGAVLQFRASLRMRKL